jgi:hypothetical protein
MACRHLLRLCGAAHGKRCRSRRRAAVGGRRLGSRPVPRADPDQRWLRPDGGCASDLDTAVADPRAPADPAQRGSGCRGPDAGGVLAELRRTSAPATSAPADSPPLAGPRWCSCGGADVAGRRCRIRPLARAARRDGRDRCRAWAAQAKKPVDRSFLASRGMAGLQQPMGASVVDALLAVVYESRACGEEERG